MGPQALEANSFRSSTQAHKVWLLVKLWKMIKSLLQYEGYTEFAPLWDNEFQKELGGLGAFSDWRRWDIERLVQLYTGTIPFKS